MTHATPGTDRIAPATDTTPRRGPGRPKSADPSTLAEAARLIGQGVSLRQAARQVGLPKSTVSRCLGLSLTPGGRFALSAEEIAQARVQRAEGASYAAIGRAMNVSYMAVKRALEAHGAA